MIKDQIPLSIPNTSKAKAKCCHVGENLAYNGFEPTAPERKSFRGIRRTNHLGLIHSFKDQQIVSFNRPTSETLIHAVYRSGPYISIKSPALMKLEALHLIPFAIKRVMEIYDEAIRLGALGYLGRTDYGQSYIKRGLALATLGEYRKAINDYSQAIISCANPTVITAADGTSRKEANDAWAHAETLYLRGVAYHELNEKENAMLDYTKAISLDPVNIDAFYNRASLHWRSGEHKKAISDYTRVISLDPNYTNAYYNRANSYLQLDQKKEAIKDYTMVLRLDPTSYHTYYTRALLYKTLGLYKWAINDFTEVIRLAPENRWTHVNDDFNPISSVLDHGNPYSHRAELYLELGQYEKAIKDFDFCRSFSSWRHRERVSYQKGIAYIKLGEYKRAINNFNEVLFGERNEKYRGVMLRAVNPERKLYADAYYYRGLSYETLGDKEKAIKDYKQAVWFNPRHKKAIEKKSELLAKMNK